MRRGMAIAGRGLAPWWLLLAACGAPSPSSSTTTGETEGTGEADGDLDDDGVDNETEAIPCELEVAALVPFVSRPDGGCSVIVRLHHETRERLGHQVSCAPWRDERLDEPQARALTDCCTEAGEALPRPDDASPWIFHAPPGEAGDPGHVAIVSELVGARVLEASIARGEGLGQIVFPAAWLGPGGVGEGCGVPSMPAPVGFDLVEGGPLAADRLDTAWALVSTTALPAAMSVMSQLERVIVIRYPRRVDPFDPSSAEYLVVLEGGAPLDPARED